jgi:predicted O-methyltransferase YrrM
MIFLFLHSPFLNIDTRPTPIPIDSHKLFKKQPTHRKPETGLLFNLCHSGAKRILEVGTSSGYSTLFLADAARANGGKVTTCELSPFKINLASQIFEKADLSDFI